MSQFNSGFPDNDQVSDVIYLLRLRNWRNKQLADTDYTQLSDAPVDADAWAQYRQALRDLPTSNANPRKIVLPAQP